MELVVRIGEARNCNAFPMVGGVDKFVVSRINPDVRNSPFIGVLKKHEVPGAKIREMDRLSRIVERGTDSRNFLHFQIGPDPVHQTRAI